MLLIASYFELYILLDRTTQTLLCEQKLCVWFQEISLAAWEKLSKCSFVADSWRIHLTSDQPAAGRRLAVGHKLAVWAVGSKITTNHYKKKKKR